MRVEQHRRHVHATGQDQAHRGKHYVGRIGLGDVTAYAQVQYGLHLPAVLGPRQHHQRQFRIACAYLRHVVKAGGTGHRQVHDQQVWQAIAFQPRVDFIDGHGGVEVDAIAQFGKLALDPFQDQVVVVGNQYLHRPRAPWPRRVARCERTLSGP